jgi:hypothetical protein
VKHFRKTRIYQLFADNRQFHRTVFTTGVQNLVLANQILEPVRQRMRTVSRPATQHVAVLQWHDTGLPD